MQAMKHDLKNEKSTALVLLNTRNIGGYKSISEMVEPDAESPWGNQFAFLHVSVPKFSVHELANNPLSFVLKAQKLIKRKRNSGAVVLTGKLLNTLRKWRGPEVCMYLLYMLKIFIIWCIWIFFFNLLELMVIRRWPKYFLRIPLMLNSELFWKIYLVLNAYSDYIEYIGKFVCFNLLDDLNISWEFLQNKGWGYSSFFYA